MAAVLRVVEVIVGLVLGCLGLGIAGLVVALGIDAWRGGGVAPLSSVGAVAIMATCGALMLFGAGKLIRGPQKPASSTGGRRWLGLAACSGTLLLLLAIALPNFLRFGGHRSPHREPKVLLKSIVAAEEGYFAEFGEYIPFDSVPSGVPGAVPVEPLAYPPGATTIGWSLDTDQAVYCRYAVAVGSFDATGERAQAFTAEAICDIDGDGASMAWGYVRPDRESGEAIPGPFGRCSAEGACDPSTGQHRAAVVGPCDEKSGSVVF